MKDFAEWKTLGRRVSQKEFDFVLVRRGTSYVACTVELDDRSHELPARKKRDKFLSKFAIPEDHPD